MKRLPLFAAAMGLALLAAPLFARSAQAFTIDDKSNTNSDGSAKYLDPGAPVSRFGSDNGQITIKRGNTTLQFGPAQRSIDQRYNNDHMFQPNGRPSGER